MTGLLIAVFCLLMGSMFTSASETSFSSINKIKLKNLADNDNKRAALVLKMNERYDRLITTILIGNNISNIAMAAVTTVIGIRLWGEGIGPTIATVTSTLLVLVVGEISPKIISREYPEEIAMAIAPILRIFIFIMTPLTIAFGGLKVLLQKMFSREKAPDFSEDELLTIVEEAEAGGAIGEEQSALIANAIEFNEVEAIDVLTPRVDIIAIEKGTSLEDIKKVFRESGLSRLPVYVDDLDDIIGVLNQKDFYNNDIEEPEDVDKYIKPVTYVSETLKAAILLKKMQARKTHIAIVVDEYGGTTGLVTLEDLIEEIVGDIYDEHDAVQSRDVIPAGQNSYMVAGGANLEDFFELFDETIEADATTVNGWVMIELDRLPSVGDSFVYDAKRKVFHVRVTRSDGRRALMTRVHIDDKPEDED